MRTVSLFLAILLGWVSPGSLTGPSPTGSVELNQYSFDKIIKKFDVVLVKFDVAFPYGEKHDAFIELAKGSSQDDDFLVAEVGIKDYGEKDNYELAKKYGAEKDNFPVVKLFIKGVSEPLTFDDSKGFTSEELQRFVRENTGVYLSMPGCVKELDMLAIKFMGTKPEDRKSILDELTKIKVDSKQSSSTKIYKTVMEKILEKGDNFLNTENKRLSKLLNDKVSAEKKKELSIKLNILQMFQLYDKQKKKEEL